jgi:hypothetical protein
VAPSQQQPTVTASSSVAASTSANVNEETTPPIRVKRKYTRKNPTVRMPTIDLTESSSDINVSSHDTSATSHDENEPKSKKRGRPAKIGRT